MSLATRDGRGCRGLSARGERVVFASGVCLRLRWCNCWIWCGESVCRVSSDSIHEVTWCEGCSIWVVCAWRRQFEFKSCARLWRGNAGGLNLDGGKGSGNVRSASMRRMLLSPLFSSASSTCLVCFPLRASRCLSPHPLLPLLPVSFLLVRWRWRSRSRGDSYKSATAAEAPSRCCAT